MKLLSLFSGIGAFEKALTNIGINIELVGFSEIDKYAIKSYCAIHNVDESLNLGDITKIDIDKLPKDIDLITHGSPCQSFSIAGKQAGGDKDSGTRSSLMWNTVDIVEKVKPKYVIWENVKNILSKKHRHNFDNYIKIMEQLGYDNYYKVLNAKDYGIPQNRERIYTVSIRRDVNQYTFKFPQKEKLKIKLIDILESEVDKKYFISQKEIKNLILEENHHFSGRVMKGQICFDNFFTNIQPKSYILIKEATKKGYKEAYNGDCINLSYSMSKTRRGRVGKGISQTLQCNNLIGVVQKGLTIRKLTPLEFWRLMGFTDKDFYKAKNQGISDTQLYKQAGNSIVVNVLEKIFRNLLNE